jgi:hypothetical protein
VANVRFLKGEIEHIPLPDASVDVINKTRTRLNQVLAVIQHQQERAAVQ